MSILEVRDVSIRYMTGDFKDIGLKEYIVRKIKGDYHVDEFWADKNISFTLEKGDMLGIIGTNGAGKSTLLKAVSSIMEPTRGYVKREGNIAALLELASGFDGDLTVRENAYLRGAMLGYTRKFMDEKYDEIIDFAELRDFQGRPFKQLSSGMKSRLAFSVASMVAPDILILDEVLSVGDGAFRKKSEEKMREIIARGATTILVSHSIQQVRELCNKVLWLEHGEQIAFGETEEICDQYERFLRGECPAKMVERSEKDEQNAQIEAIAEVDGPANHPALTFRNRIRRMLTSMVVALFFATFVFNFSIWCLERRYENHLTITAHIETGEVTFRGAYVDGRWVSPSDHVSEAGAWIYDKGQKVYTAVDETPLKFRLPAGRERTLIFYSGPDAGVVSVNLDGEYFEFDLYNAAAKELGRSYQVSDFRTQDFSKQLLIITLIGFIFAFVLYFFQLKDHPTPVEDNREVWLDALKIISAIMVVLIHSAGAIYNNNFAVDKSLWWQGLWANAVPRFAVSCFLMITGALSLSNYCNLRRVKKKVVRILIPLFFWNSMYVLSAQMLYGSDMFAGLLRIPFDRQDASLWYGYQLVWLYLGMPFWTILWRQLTNKMRWAFVVITLGIPGLLTHMEEILALNVNEYLPFASPNPMLCYVGMLFLGRLLYEMTSEMEDGKTATLGITCTVLGLLMMMCSSAYASKLAQKSLHTFFSEVRVPGVLYGAGIFLCFGALKDVFVNLPKGAKNILRTLSRVSLGVYMSHCLLIYKVLPRTIMFMGFAWNITANVLQLLGCVIIYYGMSVSICLLLSRIPVLKRLVS